MRGLFITLHEEVETRPGHQGPVYKLLCYNGRLLRAIRVLKKWLKPFVDFAGGIFRDQPCRVLRLRNRR